MLDGRRVESTDCSETSGADNNFHTSFLAITAGVIQMIVSWNVCSK
jgi:hypothetical protein